VTPVEVAEVLQAFLDGTDGPWAWDDFLSVPLRDQALERIRLVCVNLPNDHPPRSRGFYCSAEGIEVIRALVTEVRDRSGS
jgi:hypothetical protein